MKQFFPYFRFVPFALLLLPSAVLAQSIHVDATPSHSTNTIRPTEALGAGIDRLGYGCCRQTLRPDTIKQVLSAGWQTVTYRQNTELHMEAWHWNPNGTWSDPAGKGYFVGSATPGPEPIRHSYGYPLPHRGVTRDDGTDTDGYSRLTDGDPNTYWKSNPYLTETFTGESDSLHPQWVILDLAKPREISAIRIDWAEPYATHYRRSVFHRRRRRPQAHFRRLAGLPRRSDHQRQRRQRNSPTRQRSHHRSIHPHPDDRLLEHLRHPRLRRQAQLSRLRHPRNLSRHHFVRTASSTTSSATLPIRIRP